MASPQKKMEIIDTTGRSYCRLPNRQINHSRLTPPAASTPFPTLGGRGRRMLQRLTRETRRCTPAPGAIEKSNAARIPAASQTDANKCRGSVVALTGGHAKGSPGLMCSWTRCRAKERRQETLNHASRRDRSDGASTQRRQRCKVSTG